MVEHNYLQIKDYDSLDFDIDEVTNKISQNEQKIKKIDNVLFREQKSLKTLAKKYMIHCSETPIAYLGNYRIQN